MRPMAELSPLPDPPPVPEWLRQGQPVPLTDATRERLAIVREWYLDRDEEEWPVEGMDQWELPPAWWLLAMLVRYHGWRPGMPGQWRP